MTDNQTLTIDGKHYNPDDLSEQAKTQLNNLRFTDEQLNQFQNQQALAETAKAGYTRVLADNLPEKKAPANKKKDVITINGDKYNLDDFNETGRSQLNNLAFAESEITRLKNLAAIAQTARAQYGRLIAEALESIEPIKAQ